MEQSPCPSLLVSLRWCRNLTSRRDRRSVVIGKSEKSGSFFWELRLYKLYCQATGQGQADGPSYLDVSPSRNPKQQGLSKKDPRINDAQLEVPTFEASATNIGHKDYAPPPKEPSDNDFPMTMTGILSSRFLTLPANFSFFFISPFFVKDSVDTKRLITVDFAATVGNRWFGEPGGVEDDKVEHICDSKVHTSLPWEFVPQQRRVVVGLGEPTWEGMDFFFVVQVERCLFSCNCL